MFDPKRAVRYIGKLVSAILIISVLSFVIISIRNNPPPKPTITLTQPTVYGGLDNQTCEWRINSTSEPTYSFDSYKVQIFMDGIPMADPAPTLRTGGMYFGAGVWLMVQDLGLGKLMNGEKLQVGPLGNLHSWRFSLIWAADGFELASLSWSTP